MLRVGCANLQTPFKGWRFATQSDYCALLQAPVTSRASHARRLWNAPLWTLLPWSAICCQDGIPIVAANLSSDLRHLQHDLPSSDNPVCIQVVKVVCTSSCVFPEHVLSEPHLGHVVAVNARQQSPTVLICHCRHMQTHGGFVSTVKSNR